MDRFLVRNLFGIQGLNVAWYAIIMCAGIVAGALVAKLLSKKRGFKFDLIIDYLILALPLGVICARLYYVFLEWDSYAADPMEIIRVWHGGLAIYGAVIGAIIAALIFCKWKKFPIGHLLDFGGVGLIIGQAIGRWGNFVNQEAFGTPVTNPDFQWFPFSVKIDSTHYIAQFSEETGKMMHVVCDQPWHLATFFYESVWNLLVFGILLWYFYKKAKRPGNVFALYLVLYGVGRAFIEGLRTDSLWLIPGAVRISQALSMVLIVAGILYLILVRKKPLPPAYEGNYCAQPPSGQDEDAEEEEVLDADEEQAADSIKDEDGQTEAEFESGDAVFEAEDQPECAGQPSETEEQPECAGQPSETEEQPECAGQPSETEEQPECAGQPSETEEQPESGEKEE